MASRWMHSIRLLKWHTIHWMLAAERHFRALPFALIASPRYDASQIPYAIPNPHAYCIQIFWCVLSFPFTCFDLEFEQLATSVPFIFLNTFNSQLHCNHQLDRSYLPWRTWAYCWPFKINTSDSIQTNQRGRIRKKNPLNYSIDVSHFLFIDNT